MSPTYKNDHNDDVVTVTGAEAERLESLPNWHRAKVKPEQTDNDPATKPADDSETGQAEKHHKLFGLGEKPKDE